jgi:site-specific DNA-methyltransferase (adenine-specific)
VAEPYWSDATCSLHLGDCPDVLAAMEPASVDAVVTDPPYSLSFMGREWDTFTPAAFQAWCETWAAECLRVLKPGGHLLAFGGTRTWHRLACGIEDAGFEIRDSVADLTGREGPGLLWLYGSGFPKSANAERAIAVRTCILPGRHFATDLPVPVKRLPGDHVCPVTPESEPWEGWGTALKPAWEPIVVARKPLAGTVAGNVLEHGTGALNVDGCRVTAGQDYRDKCASVVGLGSNQTGDAYGEWTADRQDSAHAAGRWPPNVLLGPDAAAELDRQSGDRPGFSSQRDLQNNPRTVNAVYGAAMGALSRGNRAGFNDTGGASRFFPVFRYEAKAPSSERPRGEDGTAHPTVKPVDLMAWLVRLVTPPGGLVADPFAGSGTTAEACIVEGFRCVLIEKDPAYAALIRKRLRKDIQPAMFGDVS